MAQPKVVVWDPSGQIPEGRIVSNATTVELLEQQGVVLMPVDAELVYRMPIAGYFRKAYGDGWRFDEMVGRRGCPLLLYIEPDRTFIHWRALVVPIGSDVQGVLRLTTDSALPGALSGGLSATAEAVNLAELGEPGKYGWVIGGSTRMNCTGEGYFGLSLYGACKGIAVKWAAVSQAREP